MLQWTVGVNSTMTMLLDKKNENIDLMGIIWLHVSIPVTRPSVVITNVWLYWSIVGVDNNNTN